MPDTPSQPNSSATGDAPVDQKLTGAPERPIHTFREDRLDREPFIRRLASALINNTTQKATGVVVGLTGPWGSGKSSLLNLLREHLEEKHPDAVIVSFDPWLVSGRNDLISEFINELLATIKSKPQFSEKLQALTDTLADYGKKLEPLSGIADMALPGAGTAFAKISKLLNQFHSKKNHSLTDLRATLLQRLQEAKISIVVLIDELDRIEDHEIRTVAQLVRSVADFPGISYVLAYDHKRVIQALGSGVEEKEREERGRSYLEKIVQLQIPLPVIFDDELLRLLIAELEALQIEIGLPDNFKNVERFKELTRIFVPNLVQTPRDIKRLIGTFHVLSGMVGKEVDWIDLLAYAVLTIKAPGTVTNIHRDPDMVSGEILSAAGIAARLRRDKMEADERLYEVVPVSERTEAIIELVRSLFPMLARLRNKEHPDALCTRRPLLTVLRLGLLPGYYSKDQMVEIIAKEPIALEEFLRTAYKNDTLEKFVDQLSESYAGFRTTNHAQFWLGVAAFVKKPNCEWSTSYEPMHDVIRSFADILIRECTRSDNFKSIAATVFTTLRNSGEDVLSAVWLRLHIFMYGLFGREKQSETGAFLTREQVEAGARAMSVALRPSHISGTLIPCRWDLSPVYMMIDTGIWDDECRDKLDIVLADDRALDGFTLYLYGAHYSTGDETISKMCSLETYKTRVRARLASPTISNAHESVVVALQKAERGGAW